jgi:hypothetical protein
MCVPTLLSLANTAAQLDWLASAVAIACACALLAPPRMHQPPYTATMYVFDSLRIGVHEESTTWNSTSVPRKQKASFLHFASDEPLTGKSFCRDA